MKALLLIVPLLGVPLSVLAADSSPTTAPQPAADARTWIELQTRAGDSSAPPRPMSGEVADQAYQRYLKSFSHPIPEQFERSKFVESGGQ